MSTPASMRCPARHLPLNRKPRSTNRSLRYKHHRLLPSPQPPQSPLLLFPFSCRVTRKMTHGKRHLRPRIRQEMLEGEDRRHSTRLGMHSYIFFSYRSSLLGNAGYANSRGCVQIWQNPRCHGIFSHVSHRCQKTYRTLLNIYLGGKPRTFRPLHELVLVLEARSYLLLAMYGEPHHPHVERGFQVGFSASNGRAHCDTEYGGR